MNIFSAGAAYALLSLDGTAIGPFLISRPLVAGPVLGWWMGQTAWGFFLGMVVELIWIRKAWGQARTVDAALITALAVYWTASWEKSLASASAAALAMAIPCGYLAARMDSWIYTGLGRLGDKAAKNLAESAHGLDKALLLSLALWFGRSFVFFLGFAVLGDHLGRLILSHCPYAITLAFSQTAQWLPLLGFCAALNYFMDRGLSSWKK